MQGRYHSRDLRKGRFSEPGRIYLITTTTEDRKKIFSDFMSARCVTQALRNEERMQRAKTLAYVIMPDHLHWLMELGKHETLPKVVGDVKSVTSHLLGGNLWQTGFHDHALRKEEDLVTLARYIVANPLRAGLVDHIGDYPHWDAIWL
jgi:putative transposase